MNDLPNFKIISTWPTGVPMAFRVTVSNDTLSSGRYPSPGTTYAAIGVPVDKVHGLEYGAYEFVAMLPSSKDLSQDLYFAAPLSGQEAYNYEFYRDGEYRWPRLTQTWLIKRSAVTDVDQSTTAPPALGQSWSRFGSKLLRTTGFGPDMHVLDSLYVIFEIIYEDASEFLVGYELDPITGGSLQTITERVSNGVVGQAVDSNGLYKIVEPENDLWGIRITKKVTSLTSRTLNVIVNYSWPPVLNNIQKTLIVINSFPGARMLVNPVWTSGGYDGPCTATITEAWSASSPAAASAGTRMFPTPVVYDGIFFNLNIRSCLHSAITSSESASGSSYISNFSNSFTTPATSPTTWPSTIVAKVDVDVYRGGFIQRVLTINSPA